MDTVRETSTLIAANKVEGTDVFNAGGDRVGSIHVLMIDKRSGQVAYAIMAFRGIPRGPEQLSSAPLVAPAVQHEPWRICG